MSINSASYNRAAIFGLVLLSITAIAASPGLARTDSECYTCHADEQASAAIGQAGYRSEQRPFVDQARLEASIHRGLNCIACHADIQSLPHREELNPVNCSACHEAEGEKYLRSVHGAAFSRADPDVPSCTKCHGDHYVLPVSDPRSTVYPTNLIKVCISCHADEAIEARHNLPQQELFRAYENSVHGRAIEERGLVVAAACNDCHGTHEIKPIDDPESLSQKRNIPSICGTCHAGIYDVYSESIHGRAVDSGVEEAPVCTDCHGEHTIAKVTDPQSKVYSRNIPRTCSACHDDKEIATKYGLVSKRYTTYLNSYHGVANKFGVLSVANCATCHGVHNIRPASDPLSTINLANLPQTCGQCHPGATENFARGKIHIEATKEASLGVYLVRRFYTWFIGTLVTCFVLYAALETVGKVRRRYASQGK